MTAPAGQLSVWDVIVQRALLGTERATGTSPLQSPEELKSLLDRLDASDSERVLLAAAAVVGTYAAAGRLPTRPPTPPITQAVAEADDLTAAPPRVVRFLTTMLGGVNDEVLREWLAAVAARGWRVPTAILPALLDVGRSAPYLREAILPVLGARGRWLAARNEDWSYGAEHPLPPDGALRAAWDVGTPDERAAILAHARGRDPALGRTLLESTWKEEPPAQRAAFVELLSVGLASEDEAFLEQALDDRRQEVRRAASQLLKRLEGSALVTRMKVRAQNALRFKTGKLLRRAEIVVDPPATLDADMVRDGIEKKPPQGMGERAWWLAQIVAAVPPSTWTRLWSTTPDALVSAAASGEWAKSLTEGWAAAAMQHRDAAWAEALLSHGFPGDMPTSLAPTLNELLGVLAADRREAFVTAALRSHPHADDVVALVAAADHAWSETFARVVLAWARKRITAAAVKPGGASDWHLRELVPRLALRVPPSLASAVEDWPSGDDAGGCARAIERFITVLTFRRELAKELYR